MNEKRKKAQEYILKSFELIDQTKDKHNLKRYKEKFEKMSDKEFDEYMHRLKNKEEQIYYINTTLKDNADDNKLKEDCKKLGIKLFEKVRMWDAVTKTYYWTPDPCLILLLPIRRVSQFVDHKLSVPEGDKKIDLLSGQVLKPDQAASLSQVEIQCLYSHGLTNSIMELIKYRGGDTVAFGEYKRELEETGTTSTSKDTGSVVRSAVVLGVYYNGMHMETNITNV